MEINYKAIIYITCIIIVVSIFYVIFVIYNDVNDIKEKISNQPNVPLLEEKKSKDLNTQDLNTQDECEDESEDESRNKTASIVSIFDKVMISPEQLQQLTEFQKEVAYGDEGLNVIEELEEQEEEQQEETKDIEFVKKSQCGKVLKAGKNKGGLCGRDTYNSSGFCKFHQENN